MIPNGPFLNKLTLEHLKRHPEKKGRFTDPVLIWSGEWDAWWRPDSKGYTGDIRLAGIYSFERAWATSSHCGPEKKIAYCELNLGYRSPQHSRLFYCSTHRTCELFAKVANTDGGAASDHALDLALAGDIRGGEDIVVTVMPVDGLPTWIRCTCNMDPVISCVEVKDPNK